MQLSIEPCTGYIVQTKTLTEINDLFNSGKLDTYSVWLQRLKQKDKWAKNDWEKARSYLFRLLTSGSCSKSIFTVVDIDMLIDTIEGRLEFSTSKDVRFDIFNVMVEDLKIMKEKGCKHLLLDGQNRLEYVIKRFFNSDMNWYLINKISQKPTTIKFVKRGDNDTWYEKQSFTYAQLSAEEKDVVDNIKIVFAEGKQGQIDDFIDDLIDDNSGEYWNSFEQKITALRTLPFLVNTTMSGYPRNPKTKTKIKPIPEFVQVLDKVGKLTGDYHFEKKGYQKFICELVQYDMIGSIKLDYSVMWDNTKHKDISKSFENVKNFFRAIGKCSGFPLSRQVGGKNIFATKEMLRNFYMITQILGDGVKGYTIPLDKIKNLRALYDAYEKFDTFKRDRIKNSEDFMKSGTSDTTLIPTPGTYIWAQKDVRPEVLQVRRTTLTEWIEKNIEDWIKGHSIFDRLDRNKLTPNQKKSIIMEQQDDPFSANDYKLDRFVDDIHIDHDVQFGRGGSNEPSNLQATTASSNQSRVK